MELMEIRRELLMQPQRIQVTWNQQLYPVNSDNWSPYSTSYATATFSDGVATVTYVRAQRGYYTSLRTAIGQTRQADEKWYLSYMVYPSVDDLYWGSEVLNISGDTYRAKAPGNVWSRLSWIITSTSSGTHRTYIPNCRSTNADISVGMTVGMKSPALINLTQMFGSGNEPATVADFENQCAKNGINLETYQAQTSGASRWWIV